MNGENFMVSVDGNEEASPGEGSAPFILAEGHSRALNRGLDRGLEAEIEYWSWI